MAKVQRICEVCGASFAVNPSVVAKGRGRFCSHPCYWKWMDENQHGERHPHWKGGNIERVCQVCGKTFEVKRAVAKKVDGGKYCSWACQHIGMANLRKEKYDQVGRARTKCSCDICDKEFERSNTAIRKGEGRCCSRECLGTYRSTYLTGEKAANWKGRTTVGKCEQCGKEMRVRQARRKDGRDRFCSRPCYHNWFAEAHQGANSHLWRGGHEPYPVGWTGFVRRKVRERFDNRCAICGKTEQENKRKMAVHHIDYDKKNLDSGNLIALCHSCHGKTNINRSYWLDLFVSERYVYKEKSN